MWIPLHSKCYGSQLVQCSAVSSPPSLPPRPLKRPMGFSLLASTPMPEEMSSSPMQDCACPHNAGYTRTSSVD